MAVIPISAHDPGLPKMCYGAVCIGERRLLIVS